MREAASVGSPGVPGVVFACLLALVAALYSVSLDGPYQYDDRATVAVDPGAKTLGAWWANAERHVRPVLKASFVAGAALGQGLGDAARGQHVISVVIHLATVLVAFALGRRIAVTCLPGLAPATAARAAVAPAAVFGVHPLATEAVSYISGRSMSLGTLLALASVLAYVRARTGTRRTAWSLAALLFCAAAMLARETAFVTPALWLLWEWARRDQDTPPFSARRLRALLRLSAWPLALLAAFAIWMLTHDRYGDLLDLSRQIASRRAGEPTLLAALAYFASGFALLRYPNIDPMVVPHLLSPGARVLGGVVLGLLAVLAWRVRGTRPEFLFALAWAAAWIVPIYLLPVRHDAIAERHFYPAIWGAAFPLAVTWARWISPGQARARVAGLVAAMVVAALSVVTLARNADYRSEVALWEAAHRGSPGKLRVLNNLGVVYMEAGRWEDAQAVLLRATELAPWNAQVRENFRSARHRRLDLVGWQGGPD